MRSNPAEPESIICQVQYSGPAQTKIDHEGRPAVLTRDDETVNRHRFAAIGKLIPIVTNTGLYPRHACRNQLFDHLYQANLAEAQFSDLRIRGSCGQSPMADLSSNEDKLGGQSCFGAELLYKPNLTVLLCLFS